MTRGVAKLQVAGSLALALTTGCAAQPGVSTDSLQAEDDDQFVLSRALESYYDFALVSGNDGDPRAVSIDQAADVLADYDVVFFGEIHRHPANHLAQYELFRRLSERNADVSLSLEQFERDVQPVVDDFLAGRIGEETLRRKGRAWDNYPTSYRPLVELAKQNRLPVIAAETPVWIIRCVGQQGPSSLDKLNDEQRTWAAQSLDLSDGTYKDKYMEFLGGSGSHGGDSESEGPSEMALNSYAAQVTRDETMAESILQHLDANPGRQVVHLNGSFHSEEFLGTAERVKAGAPDLKIAVVSPVAVGDSAAPAISSKDLDKGTLLLLIQPSPEEYVSEDEMVEQIRSVMAQRTDNQCEL